MFLFLFMATLTFHDVQRPSVCLIGHNKGPRQATSTTQFAYLIGPVTAVVRRDEFASSLVCLFVSSCLCSSPR